MEKRDTSIKPYKIMIVDDDPMVIKTLERLLYKQHYLFFSVQSGEEALETIDDINPDIILLDVMMTHLSGFEVCAQLRKRGITQRIPVIFLTGNNQTSEIVKGFQSGAADYIIKPFNSQELLVRLQTHLELKKSREEIKLINKIKTRFFSIMTHDIKDAMTGVKGVAEFLNQELQQQSPDLAELKKLAWLLLDDSTQLYQFVENLIKWDHIETGVKPVLADEFCLKTLLDELTGELNSSIHQKQIKLNNNIPLDYTIHSDRDMVKNIFHELITNAIKYSYPGGSVIVNVKRNENDTEIQVIDEGTGMEREVADNVFQLDTPHPKTIGTLNEKGIGLGLVVCSALVSKLDGRITVQSEKHKGTTIFVKLPHSNI
jgi:two-component system, sensor histidine kinase and response regulator